MHSEFKGNLTILEVKCLLDDKIFYPTINSFLCGSGCPVCGGNGLINKDLLLNKCNDAAIKHGYTPIGFEKDGALDSKTKYMYLCKLHGIQFVRPYNFINNLSKCPECKREVVPHFGYYDLLKNNIDFLYVLNFNDEYIKIGRSFNVVQRICGLKSLSGCNNISIVAIYTGSHFNVWNTEQQCHQHLKSLGYEHLESSWTQETFHCESLSLAIDFIESFNLTLTTI